MLYFVRQFYIIRHHNQLALMCNTPSISNKVDLVFMYVHILKKRMYLVRFRFQFSSIALVLDTFYVKHCSVLAQYLKIYLNFVRTSLCLCRSGILINKCLLPVFGTKLPFEILCILNSKRIFCSRKTGIKC